MSEVKVSVVVLVDKRTKTGDPIGILPGSGASKICVVKCGEIPPESIGTTIRGDRAATFRGSAATSSTKQLTARGVTTLYEVTLKEGTWAKPGASKTETASESLPF